MGNSRFTRHGFVLLLIGFIGLNWSAVQKMASAQPPKKVRQEEEEDPPAKKKPPKKEEEETPPKKDVPAKKVDDPMPKPVPAPTPSPMEEERPRPTVPQSTFKIADEAAKKSRPVGARDFLRKIAIPYDILVTPLDRRLKIGLLPNRDIGSGKLAYFELYPNLVNGQSKDVASGSGYSLIPYEEWVMSEADAFLKKEIEGIKYVDKLELIYQSLGAVRGTHAQWVEGKKRVGREWDAIDARLKKKVVTCRRDQLNEFINNKDWNRADELSLELASSFSDDPEVEKDICRLILRKASASLDPTRDDDYLNLYQALIRFEQTPGAKDESIAASARRTLTDRAKNFVNEANKLVAENRSAEAFQKLRSAESLAPDLDDIRNLRKILKDKILYVAVAELPELMSPATASSDSERWAVELMFESLMQMVPDPKLGRHYRPVLAMAQPGMIPLGRDFQLCRNVRWAEENKGQAFVETGDVQGTIRLNKRLPDRRCSEGMEVLDPDQIRVPDLYRLQLTFNQGVFEPLSRTTFKILPARFMEMKNKTADDNAFARQPFGSGPYTFVKKDKETQDREVAIFRSNPFYSQRPGMISKPRIPEIRFFVPKQTTLSNEIANGQVHMVLDVPVGDLPKYLLDSKGREVFQDYKLGINRRIHMLAVNHRRPVLQSADLRRAISAAIERDEVLNQVFRPEGYKEEHTSLTGPFPVRSWATPVESRKVPLSNPILSQALATSVAKDMPIRLKLIHPDDDYSRRACQQMRNQIEKNVGQVAGHPAIEITPEPMSGALLRQRVEVEHDYELAYYTFDYRDDQFWLGGLLDPSAVGSHGRNYLGYLGDGSGTRDEDMRLRQTLEEIRMHRDFRGKLKEKTWDLHQQFNARMPFIPLWQLDRHVVVHKSLELYLDNPMVKMSPNQIDPAIMFAGVETWQIK
jgi:ABC-type transport system substrate-binding protein